MVCERKKGKKKFLIFSFTVEDARDQDFVKSD